VYFYPFAVDMVIPGRTFGGDVWIEADNGSQQTVTFGTGSGQDVTIAGFLRVDAQSTGDIVIDAATHDTDISIGSDLDIGNSGAGTEVIEAGSGTWTVSGSVNLTNCQFTIESGHTLVMDGSGGLTTGSTTLENLTLS